MSRKMSDYIKREDAIRQIVKTSAQNELDIPAIGTVIYILSEMDSADVVEVVRCKDCKHYVLHTLFGRTQGWCERLCDKFDKSLAHGTKGDDYCSYGERKDEGL